jgi:hypothetical protein
MMVETPAPTDASVMATSGALSIVNISALSMLSAERAITECNKSLESNAKQPRARIIVRSRMVIGSYPPSSSLIVVGRHPHSPI